MVAWALRSRSHATVPARPSRRSIRASQPSSSRAFSTDGQRRCTSTAKLGRCSRAKLRRILAAGLPDQRRDLGDRALLGGGDVEVLVLAGGRGHRGDDPVGDVVDVGERARLLAGAEDLQRPLAEQHLGDEIGDGVGDAGLVAVGQLARPVGVERAADRVAQAVLVVGGAGVDLAGELGEAVGRARRRARRRDGSSVVGNSVARSNTIEEET